MAQGPPYSQLDQQQITQRIFDEAEDRIRVDAEVTAVIGTVECIITDTNDSIKIGDGAGNYVDVISGRMQVDAEVTITGGATAAKQDIGNASLTSIDSKLTSPLTVTGPLTDTQLRATPVPVSGSFFQATQPVSVVTLPLPSGAATAALQTQPGVDIGDVTVNNASGGSAVNIQDGGNSITVDGTVAATQSGTWNITNVSGTISLPTGASTSAKQDTGNTSLSSIDTKAIADTLLATGTLNTGITSVIISTLGYSTVVVQIDDGSGGALPYSVNFQATVNGTDYVDTSGSNLVTLDGQIVSGTSVSGIFGFSVSGFSSFQVFGVGSSPIAIAIRAQKSSGMISSILNGVYVSSIGSSALPTGAATETTLSSINTKTPVLGQAAMTASSPVVIASNQTAIPITDNSGSLTVDNAGTFSVQVSSSALPSGAATSALQTQPGVDIGDVTINNSTGGSAVNIQDGGNSITVDNGGTFVTQSTLAAETTKVIGTVNVAAAQTIAVTQATGTNLHTVIDSGTVTTVSTVTNLSQLGGTAISMNTGVRDAGTQRVTIATNDVVPSAQSGTWNITNISGTVSLPTGAALDSSLVTLNTNLLRPATSSVTSIAGNASSVTLLALNANRKSFLLSNDSTSVCYVKFGATATTASFTMKMAGISGTQVAFYESPDRCYTGVIDAIWASATGNMRITELS